MENKVEESTPGQVVDAVEDAPAPKAGAASIALPQRSKAKDERLRLEVRVRAGKVRWE